jgi:hypothetical protein
MYEHSRAFVIDWVSNNCESFIYKRSHYIWIKDNIEYLNILCTIGLNANDESYYCSRDSFFGNLFDYEKYKHLMLLQNGELIPRRTIFDLLKQQRNINIHLRNYFDLDLNSKIPGNVDLVEHIKFYLRIYDEENMDLPSIKDLRKLLLIYYPNLN